MKSLFGFGFILLGIVTLFRYPYGPVISFPELLGVLISFAIIITPGILLIKSANKDKSKTDEN